MTDSDKIFAGSVPDIYDAYLVPQIFESYADDLAERIAALMPKTVLETAAGTGVVTRALAKRLGPDVGLISTDLSQPMLERAAKTLIPDSRIELRQADALKLPFQDNSFHAVVCQFGVMFFPDRVAGYAEARRVLAPGGTFLFNVWDRIEANELACIVSEAAASVFPDDPPRFLARTPYGHHDIRVIRDELTKAGFSEVSISTVEKTSTAPSPRHAAVAFCQGTPLRNEIMTRDAARLDDITDEAAKAIARRYGNGPVSARMRAHVIAASR